ncbi:high mobility group B protein 1-like isoform X1 [Prunus yedoensis var. nudiflora]|uniref:High mobility group B protein 1-like isoform X1 n=1 Tax=Prunus yedoensis var. nudiflora TaxID=2094558 RepID=A0A314UT41_PRUYE|nr:high mobility group B protein 1-like isoform X1 [Prunus yedoensis var. nudiflora]
MLEKLGWVRTEKERERELGLGVGDGREVAKSFGFHYLLIILSLFGFWYFSWWNCRPIPSLKDTDLVTMRAAKGKGAAKISKEALKPVDDGLKGWEAKAAADDRGIKRKARKERKGPRKTPTNLRGRLVPFSEEFRKEFKKENPNVKGVAAVGKAGGDKWKSLSDAEKAPYEAKAAKRKAEYEKQMKAYNKKQESGADDGDEESERSRSEVNDEEDEASGEKPDEVSK